MLYMPTGEALEVLPATTNRPKLSTFCKQLSTFKPNAIDSLKPSFDDLLASDEFRGLVVDDLATLANDPMRAFRWVTPSHYIIFQNANYTLRLLIEDPPKRNWPLTTAPSASVWGIVGGEASMEVDKYALPPGTNIDVFDPTVKLSLSSHDTVTVNGASIAIHATEVFAVSSRHRAVLLALNEIPALTYTWEFDRESLKPLLIQAVAPSITRLEVAVNILFHLATECGASADTRTRCESALKQMTHNEHHFIRWKATQALFKLNNSLGMNALRRAQRDNHPHVRRAAYASLAKISSDCKTRAVAGA